MAELFGIDPSMPSNWVAGKREPGPIQCLLLASVASEQEEREFWIEKSGIDNNKLRLIAEALSLPTPTVPSGEEIQLLQWWRGPQQNPMEEGIRKVVEALLRTRTEPAYPKNP
jgi:hypothetical protein